MILDVPLKSLQILCAYPMWYPWKESLEIGQLSRKALRDFDLSWWTDELGTVLDQFAEAASGRVDRKFWSSIYKISGGSGGPYITGWICILEMTRGGTPF